MIRVVLLAVSAIGGVVALGRRLADRSIENRLDTELEAARKLAMAELDREIDAVVRHHLAAYASSLLTKAGLVGGAYLLFAAGFISSIFFKAGVSVLILCFIAYDIARASRHAPLAAKLFREYGFDGRKAIKEYVAGVAFQRVYAEARTRLGTGPAKRVIAVSSFSAHELSEDVANTVAHVAHETSYDKIRARVMLALFKGGLMFAVYAGFVALIVVS